MRSEYTETLTRLLSNKLPSESKVEQLTSSLRSVLLEEQTVVKLKGNVVIFGDIHGNFEFLVSVMNAIQFTNDTKFLFLGNYVDKGSASVETMLYLTLLKLQCPERVILLRGNHENRRISYAYGFFEQSIKKYGTDNVWRYFTDLFDYLPIAATVNETFFCVHSGLSKKLQTINQLRMIDRVEETPTEGLLCDLLWSDPSDGSGWGANERGYGCTYGRDVFEEFMTRNSFKTMIKGNEFAQSGVSKRWDNKLISVWSAPVSEGQTSSKGAILTVDSASNVTVQTFPFTAAKLNRPKEQPELRYIS